MRQRAGLLTRLERLERRRVRRALPRLVWHIEGRDHDADCIGYRLSNGHAVMRMAGETLEALRARCWPLHPGTCLAALLKPSEDECEPVAEPDAPPAPAEPIDPWPEHLNGIGRRATSAELRAMGAMHLLKPEQLN